MHILLQVADGVLVRAAAGDLALVLAPAVGAASLPCVRAAEAVACGVGLARGHELVDAGEVRRLHGFGWKDEHLLARDQLAFLRNGEFEFVVTRGTEPAVFVAGHSVIWVRAVWRSCIESPNSFVFSHLLVTDLGLGRNAPTGHCNVPQKPSSERNTA